MLAGEDSKKKKKLLPLELITRERCERVEPESFNRNLAMADIYILQI